MRTRHRANLTFAFCRRLSLVRLLHSNSLCSQIDVGGLFGNLATFFHDLYELDLNSRVWRQLSSSTPLAVRADHAGVAYGDLVSTLVPSLGSNPVVSQMIIDGGQNKDTNFDDTCQCTASRSLLKGACAGLFNTSSLTWSLAPIQGALPPFRFQHAACIFGNRLFYFAGYAK